MHEEGRPSKTRLKKESHARQDLGEQLVALRNDQLAVIPLEETLRDAIREAKHITKHEARRRQMQYIGKLMRDVDPAPIQEYVDRIRGVSTQHSDWLHRLERWREQLLADPDALTRLMADHPEVDVQHLRSLLRQAAKEHAENKPSRAFREIFQWLKTLLPEPEPAPPPDPEP